MVGAEDVVPLSEEEQAALKIGTALELVQSHVVNNNSPYLLSGTYRDPEEGGTWRIEPHIDYDTGEIAYLRLLSIRSTINPEAFRIGKEKIKGRLSLHEVNGALVEDKSDLQVAELVEAKLRTLLGVPQEAPTIES